MRHLHPWLLLFSKQNNARVRASKVKKAKTETGYHLIHHVLIKEQNDSHVKRNVNETFFFQYQASDILFRNRENA